MVGANFPSELWTIRPLGTLTFSLDRLSALFLCVAAVVVLASSIFSAGYLRRYSGHYNFKALTAWYLLLFASIVLILIANDVLLFLLAWEAMSILSYLLVNFEHRRDETSRAGYLMLAMGEAGFVAVALVFLFLASKRDRWTFRRSKRRASLFCWGRLRWSGTRQLLFAFTRADSAMEWQSVNDGVMGGVSEGKFKTTERKKTLEFFGKLSLENNGGFASVRQQRPKSLGWRKATRWSPKSVATGGIIHLNLHIGEPLTAFSYRATVQAKKNEWIEVKVPLGQVRGDLVRQGLEDAGPVNPKEVNAVGFMLSDKKAGAFKMEIESIKVERLEESK